MRSTLVLLALGLFLFPSASGQDGAPCAQGTALAYLEQSGVRAPLRNDGYLFSGVDVFDRYEAPRGSGVSAIFGLRIWLSAVIEGGDTGYSEYGEPAGHRATLGGVGSLGEFVPGPIPGFGAGGYPTAADCAAADRIWRVTLADVAAYNATGLATDDLAEWPVHLGAPIVDGDGLLDNYDLAGGDRPALLGDEMAWWVMNDVGGERSFGAPDPLEVEVRVTAFSVSEAFAYDTLPTGIKDAESLHHTSFYRFEVTLKGRRPMHDVHLGVEFEPSVGAFGDNFIGSAPLRDIAFAYNADNEDEEYGANPPAVGIRFLDGPASPRLSSMMPTARPGQASRREAVYNLLRARWPTGEPLTYGGRGRAPGSPETTRWAYSTLPPGFWSQLNLDNQGSPQTPSNEWSYPAHGPFDLVPGQTEAVDIAVLWARSEAGHLDAVYRLVHEAGPAAARVPWTPYPNLTTILPGQVPVDTPETPEALDAITPAVWPLPASGMAQVRYHLARGGLVTLDVVDVLGRQVAILADGAAPAGEHRAEADVRALAPATYGVRLRLDGRLVWMGRLVVVR